MLVDSVLPQAKRGPNDHRKDALRLQLVNYKLDLNSVLLNFERLCHVILEMIAIYDCEYFALEEKTWDLA